MSRTYVHAPYRAKAVDPRWRHHFVERHDHRTGRCDLTDTDPGRPGSTACTVDIAYRGRNIHCGCKLCTGQIGRKLARRRERYECRRQIDKD